MQQDLRQGAIDDDIGSTLFEHHPYAALLVDSTGAVFRANPAAQWLARRGHFVPLSQMGAESVRLDAALLGQPRRPWQGALVLTGGDGIARAVHASLLPLSADSGDMPRWLLLLAPQQGDDRFRLVADSAPVMMWMVGADKACDWFNKAWNDFTGWESLSAIEDGWPEVVHPEDLERRSGIFDASFDARQPFSVDYRLRRRDGSYRWVLDNGAPRYAADGSFQGYTGSCVDIHERKELEERLAERTRALRLAERRKDEFLGLLTHQMRSPLAPIGNAAALMRRFESNTPELGELRRMIERQLDTLGRLLNDIVDVTRIRQAKFSLSKSRVSAGDALRSAIESSSQLLEQRRHMLRLELPDEPLWLDADAQRLAQAFGNVIANAARFTPEPGIIIVSARRDGDCVRIAVKDCGCGIAADFLPHVFDAFEQESAASARQRAGLGVGLTIARRLTQLHGGDLQAFSDGPGHGAEFVFTLPFAGQRTPDTGCGKDAGSLAAESIEAAREPV